MRPFHKSITEDKSIIHDLDNHPQPQNPMTFDAAIFPVKIKRRGAQEVPRGQI